MPPAQPPAFTCEMSGQDIITTVPLRGVNLPVLLTFDSHGSLQTASVALPRSSPRSVVPWADLMEEILGSALIHRPGTLRTGSFSLLHYTDPVGETEGALIFLTAPLPVHGEGHRREAGTWEVRQDDDVYESTLVLWDAAGMPESVSQARFDLYGGRLESNGNCMWLLHERLAG